MSAEPHQQQFTSTRGPKPAPVGKIFLWLALPVYLAFALLTPAFQTPDEQQHLFRAWQLSRLELIGERRGDEAGGVLPGGLAAATLAELGTLELHANKAMPERSSWWPRSTAPDAAPPVFHNFLGSANYSPVSYLPQVAVIVVGRAWGWSVETIVLAGRVANVLLFLTLFGLALRLTPWGAPAFLFIALHPTTASATATFGQDGLVIALSALLVAMGMRVMLGGRWNRSSLIAASTAAAGLALTKFLYLPLLFTAGAFAGRDLRTKAREALRTVGMALLAVLIAAAWLSLASAVRVPPIGDVLPPDIRVAAFLSNPGDFLHAFAGTYGRQGLEIVAGAYRFGWLNIGPVVLPMFLTIAAFRALLLVGGEGRRAPTSWQRGWLLLVGLGTLVLVNFAVWLYYTPVGMDRIRGMQSRYLLPVALVMLPALLPQGTRSQRALFWMAALLGIANVASLLAIAQAFYLSV